MPHERFEPCGRPEAWGVRDEPSASASPSPPPHFHFHVVVLDGLFSETDGEVRFDEATHFCADDARSLTPILQRRILAFLTNPELVPEFDRDQTCGA